MREKIEKIEKIKTAGKIIVVIGVAILLSGCITPTEAREGEPRNRREELGSSFKYFFLVPPYHKSC